MNLLKDRKLRRGTKRTFLKKGTCSQTFFYILNQEFGSSHPDEERAADPLAGGIYQQGYQCGMLWGSSLAVGAECYRLYEDREKAIAVAVRATQKVMASFKERTRTFECEEITKTDWSSKYSIAKYLISGKAFSCFRLAGRWAPEAIRSAREGVDNGKELPAGHTVSCASEVARKMGANDEQMVMVAGFAGGLGLSGGGCGALAAAIWMSTLARVRKQEYKYSLSDPELESIMNEFLVASDYEMECSRITGKLFETVEEHSGFIRNGGCQKLMDTLAEKTGDR